MRRRFVASDGDLGTLLNIFKAYKAEKEKDKRQWCYDHFVNSRVMGTVGDVRHQLAELCEKNGVPLDSCGSDTTAYRRCLLTGLFLNVAELQQDGTYLVLRTRQTASVHPSSVLCGQRPSCILFNELVHTTKRYMRDCCILDKEWMPQAVPKYFKAQKKA